MNETVRKLERIRDEQRRNTPSVNLDHYEAIWDSYIPVILDEPERYEELTSQLLNRMRNLIRLELADLPPHLYRAPEEPAKEWLARCYAAYCPKTAIYNPKENS